MELEDVQALVWVAEHGSLHATSKARGVSRSALRRRLDRLETAVGAPVLVTHDQGVRLTPTGQLVLDHAAELLDHRDAVLARLRDALDAPGGTVRVLTCTGFPPALTAQILALAAQNYPDVAFDVRCAAQPFELLDDRDDLVVTWADQAPPDAGSSRVFHRIPTGVFASEAYLAARGTPEHLDDLDGHVVLHEKGTPTSWPLRDGGTHPLQTTHRVDHAYLLGCSAAAGIGLALLPVGGVGLHPCFDGLRQVLPEVLGGERGVRFYAPIATKHRGPASAIVERLNAFADLL